MNYLWIVTSVFWVIAVAAWKHDDTVLFWRVITIAHIYTVGAFLVDRIKENAPIVLRPRRRKAIDVGDFTTKNRRVLLGV